MILNDFEYDFEYDLEYKHQQYLGSTYLDSTYSGSRYSGSTYSVQNTYSCTTCSGSTYSYDIFGQYVFCTMYSVVHFCTTHWQYVFVRHIGSKCSYDVLLLLVYDVFVVRIRMTYWQYVFVQRIGSTYSGSTYSVRRILQDIFGQYVFVQRIRAVRILYDVFGWYKRLQDSRIWYLMVGDSIRGVLRGLRVYQMVQESTRWFDKGLWMNGLRERTRG